jgi:hypothetical protein
MYILSKRRRRMFNKKKYKKLRIEGGKENICRIDETQLVEIEKDFKIFLGKTDYVAMERRYEGPFENKAIYLSKRYDWALGEDNDGVLCLVPLKKIQE